MKKNRLFVGDAVVSILVILICLICIVFMFVSHNTSDSVCVYVGNKLYGVFSLNDDTEFSPDGNKTFICIKDKKAYISHSDCPDGICEISPALTENSKGSIICVPNRVSLSMAKADILQNGGVDTVAG